MQQKRLISSLCPVISDHDHCCLSTWGPQAGHGWNDGIPQISFNSIGATP